MSPLAFFPGLGLVCEIYRAEISQVNPAAILHLHFTYFLAGEFIILHQSQVYQAGVEGCETWVDRLLNPS